MPESLKELSDRATPGELYVTHSQDAPERNEEDYEAPWYTLNPRDEEHGVTLTSDPKYGGWCTDGGNSGYTLRKPDAEFLAALWNAYRSGQLHDATALAEAKAQARRDAFEEAAGMAADFAEASGLTVGAGYYNAMRKMERTLRALATDPTETQKPETGESR